MRHIDHAPAPVSLPEHRTTPFVGPAWNDPLQMRDLLLDQ
jgi:hypothetical protein